MGKFQDGAQRKCTEHVQESRNTASSPGSLSDSSVRHSPLPNRDPSILISIQQSDDTEDRSPVKSKPRLTAPAEKDLSPTPSNASNSQMVSHIENFPITYQPISDATLHNMLLSLRTTLANDMHACVKEFRDDLKQVNTRVSHIETKMGEFATTFNELVDSHNAKEEDMEWMRAKIADLEDRSRRNNLKIRGIPESVSQEKLTEYVQTIFKTAPPDLSDNELIIDRIHRLPKPPHLPDKIVRDVLMRVHFYHVKERFLRTVRDPTSLPECYSTLQFFPDVSQHTILFRKKLNPITRALRQHHIAYRWGYPAKLIFSYQDETFTIFNPEQGISLLSRWKIAPMHDSSHTPHEKPGRIEPEWEVVNRKKNSKSPGLPDN